MNTIETINTDYIRSSRTIETVLVSNSNSKKVFFIYNFEGCSFRVFNSYLNLINFFKYNETESDFHFDTEIELDSFLSEVNLKN